METSLQPDPASPAASATLEVEVASSVLQEIRQHARSSMRAEICGILVGDVLEGKTRVVARIPGEGAEEAGAQVTFTQDAWEHIYRIKDKEFPELAIVGWYHSHPGFGVFLSDYDLFIHGNFFHAPHQIAWVYDPHSDEEGCFGWIGGEVAPVEKVIVTRRPVTPDAAIVEESASEHTGSSWFGRWLPRLKAELIEALCLTAIAVMAFVLGYLCRPYVDVLIFQQRPAADLPPGVARPINQ